jgi:hypothetical protein
VNIRDGAAVGERAVVSRDVEPGSVPARVCGLRQLPCKVDELALDQYLAERSWSWNAETVADRMGLPGMRAVLRRAPAGGLSLRWTLRL